MQENILIHSTKEFTTLLSIINTRSFRLSISEETFSFSQKRISYAAHPMVAFSEFRPSTLADAKITYGKYALGMSKEWARGSNISPVLYVGENSTAAKGMATLIKARKVKNKLSDDLRLAIMEVKSFVKNEVGYNSHFEVDNFDFKSENEWRYVPEKSKMDGNYISHNVSTYRRKQEYYNAKLSKYPLKFEYNDIAAIFVATKHETDEFIQLYPKLAGKVILTPWK